MKRRSNFGCAPPVVTVSFGDVDPNPLAPLHRRLGIRTFVHRQAILNDMTSDRGSAFDPVTRTGPSNHLFRVNVTLADVA